MKIRYNPFKTATLVLTLALVAGGTNPLYAELLDDFDDGNLDGWVLDTSQGGNIDIVNGQLRLSIPDVAEDRAVWANYESRTFTIEEGRTLRFEIDLIQSSRDGAVALLGFVLERDSLGNEYYGISIDEDGLAIGKHMLHKRSFVFRNEPIKAQNIRLILTLTGQNGDVVINVRVHDHDAGGVLLFEETVRDTPESDPLASGTDDSPQPYLNLPGYFDLLLLHDQGWWDTDTDPGESVITLDNAEVYEYASRPRLHNRLEGSYAQITWGCDNPWNMWSAVLLESLTVQGPWTPSPHPILSGKLSCLHAYVPPAAPTRFFILQRGKRFMESFEVEPLDWTPRFYDDKDPAKFTWGIADRALRIQGDAPTPSGLGFLLLPDELEGVILSDVAMFLDILDWDENAITQSVGFAFRGGANPSEGYLAEFITGDSDVAEGRASLSFWKLSSGTFAKTDFSLELKRPLRLVLTAAGQRLKLSLLQVEDPDHLSFVGIGDPIATVEATDSSFSQGGVGLWIWSGSEWSAYDVIVNNFYVSGTTPGH